MFTVLLHNINVTPGKTHCLRLHQGTLHEHLDQIKQEESITSKQFTIYK